MQHVSNGKGQVDVLSLGVMEQGDAHSQFDAWGDSRPAGIAGRSQGVNSSEERYGPVSIRPCECHQAVPSPCCSDTLSRILAKKRLRDLAQAEHMLAKKQFSA